MTRLLAAFAKEIEQIYITFFNRLGLPSSIAALKKQGMAHGYYRAASIAFWSDVFSDARYYLLKSISDNLLNWKAWAIFFLSQSPDMRSAYIKKRKNPYY